MNTNPTLDESNLVPPNSYYEDQIDGVERNNIDSFLGKRSSPYNPRNNPPSQKGVGIGNWKKSKEQHNSQMTERN